MSTLAAYTTVFMVAAFLTCLYLLLDTNDRAGDVECQHAWTLGRYTVAPTGVSPLVWRCELCDDTVTYETNAAA